MRPEDIRELTRETGDRVLLLVLDGLGGLPREAGGETALEAARTPHMDELLRDGGAGLQDPVAPGITPGSGPGHLALFGYDPLAYRVGRGVLEALGIGFDIREGDVAARGNFCNVDANGVVTDRRAGRIPTEEARELVQLLDGIEMEGVRALVREVKEHRFLLVLRSQRELSAQVEDTDPGRPGQEPGEPRPSSPAGEETAGIVGSWLDHASRRLSGRERGNMVLLRGFARLPDWPEFPEVYRMRSLAVAAYPMYRGVARLVGMEAVEGPVDPSGFPAIVRQRAGDHDFLFLHVKGTDRAGEDGDFDRKVAVIEAADAAVPELFSPGGRQVTIITGDHSTPATMKSHSWHPVPFLISGGIPGRRERARSFGEEECARGSLGRLRGRDLLPLAAARAGRLGKYGA